MENKLLLHAMKAKKMFKGKLRIRIKIRKIGTYMSIL